MTPPISRRDFAKAAALAGVGVAATTRAGSTPARPATTRATTTTAPSQRIRLGFIGVGNRGDQVLNGFLAHQDAQVVAVCDAYRPYLDAAAKKIGDGVAQYNDYRRLLDRKDVDAVVVATPDHWHALHTIHACQAGKDVFVEKPLSLSVAEGRAMVNAARRHKRVTQVGLHRRSSDTCREIAELIQGGAIGKVTAARSFHIQNESPHGIGRHADSQPPRDLDYDAFLGPAPLRPYNVNRGLYRFRWSWDYSGGQLTNTGAHYLDLIQWCLGEESPRSVAAMGGRVGDFDDREVPDTLEAMWTYPSGTLVTFSQFNANAAGGAAKPCEVEFRGTKGTLYFRGNGYEIVPESGTTREYPILSPLARGNTKGWKSDKPLVEPRERRDAGDVTAAHARNFLDCVASRRRCNCDIETGHRATTATIIANIALETRSMLEWDGRAERFTNNDDANRHLSYAYREPYELPTGG